MQRALTIGTAGHIDHGKTALVRALTGVDTDRLPQEKSRGITIDLGFAYLNLGDTRIGIVDVPGHERFIKNMLAGAAGFEAALLVVAADDSVMPQTREHLAILDMLGVRYGIIVITKCDLAKPDWLELVEAELSELVEPTSLRGSPIVRTSATTGEGIDALSAELERLAQRIEIAERREPFRMPIDRCFVVEGRGTVVTGTIWSGEIRVDDEVELLPACERAKVRGLQSHASGAERLARGQRAAINLAGVHHSQIERGHELATPGFLVPSRRLTVMLRLLGEAPWPLKPRARVRVHLGTAEVMASVRLLEGSRLEPGGSMLAQIVCAEPVVATCRQPLVIRAESPLVTIGGGQVLQPRASLIRSSQTDLIDRLRAFDSNDPAERAGAAIYFGGGLDDLGFARDAGLRFDEIEDTMCQLIASDEIVSLSDAEVIHGARLAEVEGRIEGWLAQFHEQNPLQPGAPALTLAMQLDDVPTNVVDAGIARLSAARRVVQQGERVRLASYKPALSEAQLELLGRVRTIYGETGFKPPDIGELARELGESDRAMRTVLDVAVASGELIHLGGGLYMDVRVERAMRERVEDHLEKAGEMPMSELRTLLETSRKYAVPLGEYLDRAGVTRRRGDMRVLAKPIRAEAR